MIAKKESRQQSIHKKLQKLEKLVDPDGHFRREWEKDRNLQMARDHYMMLLRHAHERAERAARKAQLKVVVPGYLLVSWRSSFLQPVGGHRGGP